MHRLQNGSIRPGKICGAHLNTCVFVQLFAHVEVIRGSVKPQSVQHLVTGIDSSLGKHLVILKLIILAVSPNLFPVLNSPHFRESFVVHCFNGTIVVQLSKSSSRQNPRVATSILITFISTIKNTTITVRGILLVDRECRVKNIVQNTDGLGDAVVIGSKETIIQIPIIETQNGSNIFFSVGALENVVTIVVVGEDGGVDGIRSITVLGGSRRITHLVSNHSTNGKAITESTVTIPEKVGGLDFFPQITTIGLPIVSHPV
mmetsp:Transcript_620/g.1040  ORF Transcript_620/g.1040 Transcript_620/m.1040 type:complete len:260 (+) Transcript_620:74-853(+)